METQASGPIETIRLSEKEKEKLIWAINASPQYYVGQDLSRLHVTAVNTNAVLSMSEDQSSSMEYAVVAYSHGRMGISVIHGRYVHPGKRCRVRFRSMNGEWHERVGKTGQCIHVQGLIHALLVAFDESINLDEFAMLTPDQETRHLKEIAQDMPDIDQQEFVGLVSKVLFVDDQPSDRKLMNYWLNRAGMQITTAASIASAQQMLEEDRFDIMIVDMILGNESGMELIRSARAHRFVQPIVAVSADEGEQMKSDSLDAGANVFIAKPIEQHALVTTMKELMGLDPNSDDAPIYSTFGSDPEMLPLLTGYVRSLETKVRDLQEANANHNFEKIERIASTLKGCGEGYGYPEVTVSATAVIASLEDSSPDIEQIKRTTNSLIQIISRIRLNRPTATQPEPVEEDEYI